MANEKSVGLIIAQLNANIRAQLAVKDLEAAISEEKRNEHSNGSLAMRFNQEYFDQLTLSIKILSQYMLEDQGVKETSNEHFKELAIEYNKKLGKINQTAIGALEELQNMYGIAGQKAVGQKEVIRYLISLEGSKFERGTAKVERKLKQWLFLGYSEEITAHKLRNAGYSSNEYKETNIAFSTVKKVVEAYKDEIKEHNDKFKK